MNELLHTFFFMKSTIGAGEIGNMGKRFVVVSIEDEQGEARKATIKPQEEQNGRSRILHLEPVRSVEASGIEMDENRVLENTTGYLLLGVKPLKDWEVGDIVEDIAYPTDFDR